MLLGLAFLLVMRGIQKNPSTQICPKYADAAAGWNVSHAKSAKVVKKSKILTSRTLRTWREIFHGFLQLPPSPVRAAVPLRRGLAAFTGGGGCPYGVGLLPQRGVWVPPTRGFGSPNGAGGLLY